jgi:hypothetical protein
MDTIVFFHRSELTDLYGSISNEIENEYEIIHVAYSSYEKKILNNKYGITPNYVFQDLLKEKIENKIDKLIIDELDKIIIQETNGRFCLNSSIQSDRGFCLLNYEDALILSQSQYIVWKQIFENHNINFFYHEPPSLFMNHIASILCLHYNAKYCYDSMVKGENEYDYIFLIQDTAVSPMLNYHLNTITEKDVSDNKYRIETFLNNFRKTYEVYSGDKIKNKINYFFLLKNILKKLLLSLYKIRKLNKLFDNIDYYLIQKNDSWETLKNLIKYKLKITFEELDIKKDYYYYSMNLEPEATVLYLGDNIYENQVKLIINIAAQLPPNTYLYVKDHPHYIGYRDYKDYTKLMKVPNIKLLKSEIPGKAIIKNCIGLFIINGTAGLEAILLNKQVYTFGNMFFNVSDRVNYIKNIKDLREIVYSNHEVTYKDDLNLNRFVLAYLNSINKGVTDYFQGRIEIYKIDKNENVKNIAKDLVRFLKHINSKVN